MPNVLVRDLPPHVHAQLVQRAEATGLSLQQYLTAALTNLADTPTIDEVVARIEGRAGGAVGFGQAGADIDAERDRR